MDIATVTVMVVDLIDSTPLIASVPHLRMAESITDAVGFVRNEVEEGGGRVVKFTGDGYMVSFRSATGGLRLAVRIAQAFRSQPLLPNGERNSGCRIVLHTCDVVPFENDLLGEGVVIPARLEKQVPPNSVYVTSTTREVAKSAEFRFESRGEVALKGLPEPVTVFEVVAEAFTGIEHDAYMTVTDLVGLTDLSSRLTVEDLNTILERWVQVHRLCLARTSGRFRSIVGDNVIATHRTANAAIDYLSELTTQLAMQGDPFGEAHKRFSAVVKHGDLIVSDYGISGALVSGAFRLLQQLPAGSRAVTAAVAAALSAPQSARVVQSPTHVGPEVLYYVPTEQSA